MRNVHPLFRVYEIELTRSRGPSALIFPCPSVFLNRKHRSSFCCRLLRGGAPRDPFLHPLHAEGAHPQGDRGMEQLAPGLLSCSPRALPRERLPGYSESLSTTRIPRNVLQNSADSPMDLLFFSLSLSLFFSPFFSLSLFYYSYIYLVYKCNTLKIMYAMFQRLRECYPRQGVYSNLIKNSLSILGFSRYIYLKFQVRLENIFNATLT